MRLSAVASHPRQWNYDRVRRSVGRTYLTGSGIEIGALHNPYPVPEGFHVRYLDRLSSAELQHEYPELGEHQLVEVDVVDDGETLATLDDESVDFVIASHFLEHCQDPIGALKNHLRVVRGGGVVILALPDRTRNFDRSRAATTLAHLVVDHEAGPNSSRADHYREWATLVDLPLGNVSADQVDEHAMGLEQRQYSIHFHCWTAEEFTVQLREIIRRFQLPAEIVKFRDNYHEFLVVLRRTN